MNNIIKSIQDLKIVLPEAAKPVANYSPYVLFENTIYVSGQIPFKDGIIVYKGISFGDPITPVLDEISLIWREIYYDFVKYHFITIGGGGQ